MRSRRDREGGFTLIEILIAFAILAIGLLVLIGPISGGLSRNARDQDDEQAVLLAQTKIAELGTQTPWFVGTRQGDIDDRFSWRLEVMPSDDRHDREAGDSPWHVLDVVVEISWSSAFGRRSFVLTTTRLIPTAALES